MKSIWVCFVALILVAYALVPRPTSSQEITNDQKLASEQKLTVDRIFYPPEFSPLVASRLPEKEESLAPTAKFVKVSKAIAKRYIVVLNDDVVASDAPLKTRSDTVTAIADSHAKEYEGKVAYIYETALKGYSVELPNENAAIKLSRDPQVRWVEEVGRLEVADTEAIEFNPPWGLDGIDGSFPLTGQVLQNGTTNGQYIYNSSGAGVFAYVLDTGLRTTHQDFALFPFGTRASIAADFIRFANGISGPPSPYLDSCIFPKPTATDNDCFGHGTHVAATLGGNTYGVAKSPWILSVKVCTANFYGCPTDVLDAGINFVTAQHNAGPGNPILANMSISGPIIPSTDIAVQNSIDSGVTYAVAAGNVNDDVRFYSPAHIPAALTVGSVDAAGNRVTSCQPGPGSAFGSGVDFFAPGFYVVSAWSSADNATVINCGTSMATPHGAGTVALYLQGRPGANNCTTWPIQGRASTQGASISTCPDRVTRFIDANTNLNKLTGVGGTDHNGVTVNSANRFLLTANILTPPKNPIDNQRFFIWQQYSDFLPYSPDNGGLDFWTKQITNGCGTGVNDNNACTRNIRALVSKEFFRVAHPSAFSDNSDFVHKCYEKYLRRTVSDTNSGFLFWLGVLNSYGSPASEAGKTALIDAFIGDPASNGEYRLRFGQSQP